MNNYDDDVIESSSVAESYQDDGDFLAKPIIVGYVFGPKKMSSMGMVMAEASRTKLMTDAIDPQPQDVYESYHDDEDRRNMPSPGDCSLTKAILSSHNREKSPTTLPSSSLEEMQRKSPPYPKEAIIFTIDGQTPQNGGGLRNIVQYFRSSCSSVADSESTGTCTASTGSQRTSGSAHANKSISSSSRHSSAMQKGYPLHVSFVPLDPDTPLEEQHGGHMDCILHKLTEDILCLSQLCMEKPELRNMICSADDDTAMEVSGTEHAAITRVRRLCQFQKAHPECCLVDDPVCVQTLMSRSDIADTLQQCLQGVTSTSGIPVTSPRSVAILRKDEGRALEKINSAGLSFPLIVKPLTAAGTKASHSMAVMTDESAVAKITDKVPCLCQEYVNHDAMLYKVYVLGDHVSVHKRRSLPNLPRGIKSTNSYLEFDSQRPYPRLSEFGFTKTIKAAYSSNSQNPKRQRQTEDKDKLSRLQLKVNEEEIKPLVEKLKQAFGLELFGFDVLITEYSKDTERQMLVVDVNYFPSYKEVHNFPALLAKYLTDRAIESRKKYLLLEARP